MKLCHVFHNCVVEVNCCMLLAYFAWAHKLVYANNSVINNEY